MAHDRGGHPNGFERAVEEHRRVLVDSIEVLASTFDAVLEEFIGCVDRAGRILVCGNGGSAADAQHFTAELVGRFRVDRRAIAALALHTDTSALTAIANDAGFDRVFARQVEAFGQAGDLLVAISTSGSSANVVEAARTGAERGLVVVALTGAGGGRLAEHADHLLAVPSTVVARVQEVHELLLHALAEAIEEFLQTENGGRDA